MYKVFSKFKGENVKVETKTESLQMAVLCLHQLQMQWKGYPSSWRPRVWIVKDGVPVDDCSKEFMDAYESILSTN